MFQVSNLKNENQQFDETIEGSNLYDKPLKKGQFFFNKSSISKISKQFSGNKKKPDQQRGTISTKKPSTKVEDLNLGPNVKVPVTGPKKPQV